MKSPTKNQPLEGPQGEHIRKRSPSEDMPTKGLLSLKGVRRTD